MGKRKRFYVAHSRPWFLKPSEWADWTREEYVAFLAGRIPPGVEAPGCFCIVIEPPKEEIGI